MFGVYEWASHSVNCISGCLHNCKYCYAKAKAIKIGKKTKETWAIESVSEKALVKSYEKKNGTIMFPTTHDITPCNIEACLIVLRKLLAAGNNLLIVSKPYAVCILKLCQELEIYKDNILFRFTIGSVDNSVLKFWEPNAPSIMDRLSSLRLAKKLGFRTSISCEPMLDNRVEEIIDLSEILVTDSVWLGKMNFVEERLTTNGEIEAIGPAKQLIELQDNNFVLNLYEKYKNNPIVKWKDSLKEIIGLERPTKSGLDI